MRSAYCRKPSSGFMAHSNVVVALLSLVALHFVPYYIQGTVSADSGSNTTVGFRCMRPFASLPRFSSTSMDAAENCKFKRYNVLNASAVVKCESTGNATGKAEPTAVTSTCSVTIHAAFRTMGGGKDDNADAADVYRYSLQLRAINNSVVHYKGFDQNGYGLCCSFIEGAKCTWEERETSGVQEAKQEVNATTSQAPTVKEPAVVSCPLHHGEEEHIAFRGSTVKPLHRLVVGNWEARLEFWRGGPSNREVLGRLLVPFRLTDENIAQGNNNTITERSDHTTAVVVVAEQGQLTGSRGDL
ncbi:hypothetical protein, conserved [Trypanosoma brucei brucei TREU927]|uniref:Uncharacterized protein n=2 Tax=Trypanozoon TaxID=39700 RepID=Q38CG9_TRYB2|nr:hypothetical protein, conserved [Trypanosoma brucei brucei TREU927]EAN77501.1 hypothetical protein, conserved [Trypanosoma brucei brucei TREU927]